MPSPSNSPPPPISASNSEISASPAAANSNNQAEAANNNVNGVFHLDDKKPDPFDDLDSDAYIERFRKYEADYTCRLLAKYFSKKTLYGGDIFDDNTTVDGETIKSSRWPCTRSYADPVRAFEDHGSSGSTAVPESPTEILNGKHMVKKSC